MSNNNVVYMYANTMGPPPIPSPPPPNQERSEPLPPFPKPAPRVEVKPQPAPEPEVPMKFAPQRPIEERALEMLPGKWLFEEEPLPDANQPIKIGEMLVLDTRVNAALRLAHKSSFMAMIAHCLWGDEQDTELLRLGYLARGAVMTFQPTNPFELSLVGNVVAAQWKLDRTLRIQKAVFDKHAAKPVAGRHGLPTATWAAMELDEEAVKAQKMLDMAVNTYQNATKKSRMSVNW